MALKERADYFARVTSLVGDSATGLRRFEGTEGRGYCSCFFVSGTKCRGPIDFNIADRFLGGPGVGKGTQCARVAEEFDFHHICVGDLLREEAKSPTSPYKDFIPESISKSVLLPAQLTTMLLKREMERAQADGTRRFLLDGNARSEVQALDFELKGHSY